MGKERLKQKSFYTTKDLVETFRINVDTAQRMCRQGRIRTTRVGRRYRISPEEWRRLLQEGIPAGVVVEDPEQTED